MNTPTRQTLATPPSSESLEIREFAACLSQRLETVAVDGAAVVARQQRTPTPEFEPLPPHAVIVESFQWECEGLRSSFPNHSADKHRKRIEDPAYWELECRQYRNALDHVLRERVGDGKPLALAYQKLLRHAGLSAAEIRALRSSISDQHYWKTEADMLRAEVAAQEHKMRLELRRQRRRVSKGARRYRFTMTDKNNPPLDLSRVVLILGSFVGVDDILQLSENSRYSFAPSSDWPDGWMGGQPCHELSPPYLALTIGEHLFEPQGWVLGSNSDADVCDLQVAADNQTGISGRHLRIDISPVSHNPRVASFKRPIRVHDTTSNRVMVCNPGETRELSAPVILDLGPVRIRAWPPVRNALEARRYRESALGFSKDILESVPRYIPSIESRHPETQTSNTRCGKHGTVYVRVTGTESRGASASVMMVREITSGRIFGAKEPFYRASDDHDRARERLESLQREFNHIVGLDHPHIMNVLELVHADDPTLPPWMIVEYIPTNLSDILHTLEDEQKPIVLLHLASALHYMHSCGLAHRDVKPANVLVQMEPTFAVKLADFGTSRNGGSSGEMETFTGTPAYMAPELFAERRSYTNKVDMWALGLVALQVFTSWSVVPVADRSNSFFDPWMRGVVIPRIRQAPDTIQPLLVNMLRKDPRRRIDADVCLAWLSDRLGDGSDVGDGDEGGFQGDKSEDFEHESALRLRSPNPSLSTNRAKACSTEMETTSAASTPPHQDDHAATDAGAYAPELGLDVDWYLEHDWQDESDDVGCTHACP
ncbi:kinase-like domain-containing protein [Echria macrotheca]|uniref:non-specific serine/threonine protein kinase n=1 Tax=Echria macrotheca TaxID=438768 RepID=A0AAJ0B373_9PEZI|nr:kinase-like domain-containing protein [Echria macrotheca]